MALTKIDDRGLKTPIDLLDNEKIRFGTGNDLEIYHDINNSVIKDVGTGNLILQSTAGEVQLSKDSSWEAMVRAIVDGSVELYYDGVKKAETTGDGLQINGVTVSTGNIQINNDTSKIRLGASQDLQIYFNGTDSYINHVPTSGKLQIRTDEIRISSYDGDEAMIKSFKDAATYLYYDGSNKFETTSSGSKTTGTLHATSTGVVARFEREGTANGKYDFQLFNDSGNDCSLALIDSKASATRLTISSAGNATFAGNIHVQHIRNDGIYLKNAAGTENYIDCSPNAEVSLFYDNVKTLTTTSTGILVNNPASSGDAVVNVKGGEGGSAIIQLQSDEGDDNADFYRLLVPDTSQFNIQTYTSGSWANILTLDNSSNATFAGTVSDSKGNLRSIPPNVQHSNYTLVASDAGKVIYINANPTINNSVFSQGDAVTIVNNGSSDRTIVQGSGVTLYNTVDATTGNRTLAQRGMATIWFYDASTAYISGAGLS